VATNEQEAPPEPTPIEKISKQMGLRVAKVTDTGAQSGIPLRVWLIVVALGVIVSTALIPLNYVGAGLVVALALTLGSRSRGGAR
jgi:hypothetical protein